MRRMTASAFLLIMGICLLIPADARANPFIGHRAKGTWLRISETGAQMLVTIGRDGSFATAGGEVPPVCHPTFRRENGT